MSLPSAVCNILKTVAYPLSNSYSTNIRLSIHRHSPVSIVHSNLNAHNGTDYAGTVFEMVIFVKSV